MNTLLAESLLLTYCFPHAAVVRRKDHVVKARTPDFPLTTADLERIATFFEHPIAAREQGIALAGLPYRVVRVDASSIYAKLDEDTLAVMRQLGMTAATAIGGASASAGPQTTTAADVGVGGTRSGGNGACADPMRANSTAGTVGAQGTAATPGTASTGANGGAGGMAGSAVPAAGAAATTGRGPPLMGTAASSTTERDKTVVEVVRPSSATFAIKRYDGIIICRTVMYHIIGIYDRHPGMAVEAMERLADYFRSKNR
ncbi:Profilin-4 [Blastocladiella emersonii ATCC 22665]|nr:Profilin-4 [Blastocladiella emersonii ATCC 22665]